MELVNPGSIFYNVITLNILGVACHIESFLPDILGFACIPTFAVVLAPGDGWMDIAVIPEEKDRLNAKYMLVVLCRHLLVNRSKYATIHEAVKDIVRVCEDFLAKL